MKIIATIGPKSMDKWVIKDIVENGADILRLNCSHFNKEEFETVLRYSREIKNDVHIMADLSGKKTRISKNLKHIYKVYNNQQVYFCAEDYYNELSIKELKDRRYIPLNITTERINKSNIYSISMKDNTMNFEIKNKINGIVMAKVLKGGIIRGGKGCNISELYDDNIDLSKNDSENIEWALENNIDIICQSFVEKKSDIEVIKALIKKRNKSCDIWAKVETPTGINNLNEILEVVDTIVIGRGDLVPEAGLLNSIKYQEKAIRIVNERNKKIIIATHLLNSMKNGTLATIPEIESIYKFINYGIDGFLLAGETSIGRVPIQTVKFLKDTIDYYSIKEEGYE